MFENTVLLFTNENTIYNIQLRFTVILIILSVFIAAFKFLPDYYIIVVVILFVFGLYLVEIFLSIKAKTITTFNDETMYKLQQLQLKMDEYIDYTITKRKLNISNSGRSKWKDENLLEYIYTDVDIIHFLYDILPFYEYNPDQFYKLLKGTNNILKLKKESDDYYKANKKYIQGIADFVRISFNIKKNCMNILHDFVYTMPKIPEMFEYHNVIITKYDKIMTRFMNDFYTDYEKDVHSNINTNTSFIRYRPDIKLPNSAHNTKPNVYFS